MAMLTPETAYRDFRHKLHRYIASRNANPQDIEDILQDVFVRVSRNADSLEKVSKPLAWLFTVTNSAIIDHARKRQKNPLSKAHDIELAPQLSSTEHLEKEFGNCLSSLLENLPEKYRNAVRFVDMQDGRQTEFARKNNLSIPAAKSRVQRGRRLLKTAILDCCHIERDNLQNVTGLQCRRDACR